MNDFSFEVVEKMLKKEKKKEKEKVFNNNVENLVWNVENLLIKLSFIQKILNKNSDALIFIKK